MKKIILSLALTLSSLLVNATPNPPGLTSPADGTVFASTVSPTLRISKVSNGFWYWFQWSEDSTFTTHDDYTISSSYSALTVNSLKFNTKYYWRVFTIGYNHADTSVASEVRCFTTCSTVNITSPANNTTLINSVKPLLYWDQVTGAANMQLEWDTAATFDSPLRNDYTVTNSGTSLYVNRLRFGTKYYWHARAINTADTSMWSNTFCFTTSSTVSLANPYNGAPNQSLRPILEVTTMTGTGHYIFEWDTTMLFNSPFHGSMSSTSKSSTINPSLKMGAHYYWRARATNSDDSDTSAWSSCRQFTTYGGTPTLSSPSNNAMGQPISLNLDWITVSGISCYDYECDTSASFNSPALRSGSVASGTTEVQVSNLYFGTKYYWHVRTRSNSDTSLWSATWCFTTANTISLTSPTNNSTLIRTILPTLDWDYINGGTFYEYQYSLDDSFPDSATFAGSVAVGTSEVTLTSPLLFGETYAWRVRELSAVDTTPWSAVWHFTTPNVLPLTSPANNSTGKSTTLTLDWDYINGGTTYEYQYDTVSDFSSDALVIGTKAVGTSEVQISRLRLGTKYYWRVRELSAIDTTAWSAVWNFTTTGGCPTLSSPSNNATGQSILPTIDWNPVGGSDYYDYQCDTTLSFNSSELQYGSIAVGMSEVTLDTLRFGTKYYWRVRSRLGTDTSQWSNAWNFTTAAKLTLTAPSNGKTNVGSSVMLDWIYIAGGTIYEYQYDTAATFDSPVLVNGSVAVGTSEANISGLMVNSTYYWCVRELSSVDTTVWSDVWHFSTVRTSYTSDFYQSACDSFFWYGQWYYQSGDYVQLLQASDRGDSTVTMHLTINYSVETEFSVTTQGSFIWAGQSLTQSGDYTFTFTSTEGCDSTVTLHLTITTPTVINDINGEMIVYVYPNPTTGIVHINDYNGEIWIYDLNGKLVMKDEGDSVDITPLPAGNYLLRISRGRTFPILKR